MVVIVCYLHITKTGKIAPLCNKWHIFKHFENVFNLIFSSFDKKSQHLKLLPPIINSDFSKVHIPLKARKMSNRSGPETFCKI